METVKITKEQLNLFVWAGKAYVTQNPRESKLWYAIKKILPKAIKKLQLVEDQKELERVALAKKDADKFVENDANGHKKFDEASNKTLIEKLRAIENEEIEIPCHIIPLEDVNEKLLSYDTRAAFEGIVVPKIDYEELDIDAMFAEGNQRQLK